MIRILGPSIILILLLLGCTNSSSDTARTKDSSKSGILVMNQFQGFSTLHPPSSYENSSAQLGSHILETLVSYDPSTLELTPLLAERWEVNPESTEFTLTIRSNVYFHDDPCFPNGKGRLMTAEDVLYCLLKLCEKNPMNHSSWLLIDRVKGAKEFYEGGKNAETDELPGITLVDDHTIKISLVRANVEFLHLLAHYSTSIYPKEARKMYGRQVGKHPIGTGPFKVKVIRMDEVCILERNERYWGVDEQGNSLPYLLGVKVGFIKNGWELSKSMKKGFLHLVMDADIVEGGDAINQVLQEMPDQYEETFEFELETVYLAFLNSSGVFQDVRIRKAFGLALDKDQITEDALFHSGEPGLYGIVPPGFKNYPYADVRSAAYDVQKAQELLAEAGFPNGEGFPVVTLQIQNRYRDVVVAQEIQRQILEHLGISLSVTALPRNQHFERAGDGSASLWLDNWIADYRAPENFLNIMISTNTPEEGSSYLNTYRYKNSKFDALVEQSMQITDEVARYKVYAEADEQLIVEDAAVVPIYYERNKIIRHVSVKNLHPPMFGRFDLRKVYIEETP